MNEERGFVSVGKASKLAGLHPHTIRKMADEASIICYKTPTGQRRINLSSLQKMCHPSVHAEEEQIVSKKNFLYTRVSTRKQMDDLSRQCDYLQRPEYSEYTLVQDIGSGINFKRKGLSSILDSCLQKTIGEVVVAHRDRLCRFGFELIEYLVTKSGGRITVLQDSPSRTGEQELADDLLAIIHVFSCRQMGRRSYGRKKDVENVTSQNISNTKTKKPIG
jgi:predicted site-specific integrase-resolvase